MPFLLPACTRGRKFLVFPLRALICGFGGRYSACSVTGGGVQRSRYCVLLKQPRNAAHADPELLGYLLGDGT
jgi:hypothetical protein